MRQPPLALLVQRPHRQDRERRLLRLKLVLGNVSLQPTELLGKQVSG